MRARCGTFLMYRGILLGEEVPWGGGGEISDLGTFLTFSISRYEVQEVKWLFSTIT